VLAASEAGGLLNAPDATCKNIIVGPSSKGRGGTSTRPVKDNLKRYCAAVDREIEDLVVIVLDRPRHEKLIEDISRRRSPAFV
jgi:fructose-1,6-bisphosphatase/sedoheptulose 1,7-bisphosphatase-like protein